LSLQSEARRDVRDRVIIEPEVADGDPLAVIHARNVH
jgi:hypothetical protein